MRIYCLYGVGKATERAYHFYTPEKLSTGDMDGGAGATEIEAAAASDDVAPHASPTAPAAASLARLTTDSVIANYVTNDTAHVYAGVQMGDGTPPHRPSRRDLRQHHHTRARVVRRVRLPSPVLRSAVHHPAPSYDAECCRAQEMAPCRW